jgi:hypothetical protein
MLVLLHRTAKPNHDLLDHPLEATTAADPVAAMVAAMVEVLWGVAVVVVVEVVEVVLLDSSTSPTFVTPILFRYSLDVQVVNTRQLPFNVGWQDLKDLFRQAGKTLASRCL